MLSHIQEVYIFSYLQCFFPEMKPQDKKRKGTDKKRKHF